MTQDLAASVQAHLERRYRRICEAVHTEIVSRTRKQLTQVNKNLDIDDALKFKLEDLESKIQVVDENGHFQIKMDPELRERMYLFERGSAELNIPPTPVWRGIIKDMKQLLQTEFRRA